MHLLDSVFMSLTFELFVLFVTLLTAMLEREGSTTPMPLRLKIHDVVDRRRRVSCAQAKRETQTQTAMSLTIRELFGGAITASLPLNLVDAS